MATDELRLTEVPAVKTGMLIRRPPAEVFRAFADPAVTTRLWYTKSSGPMVAGATLTWEWENYGVSTKVVVKEVEDASRIVFTWGEGPTTVELLFTPWKDDGTFVRVTETGMTGSGDELAAYAADSVGGFSLVLSAVKALLEHDVVLGVVPDRHPEGA